MVCLVLTQNLHISATRKRALTETSPRKPTHTSYVTEPYPHNPHANVARQLAPRKIVLGRPFPTQISDLTWVCEAGVCPMLFCFSYLTISFFIWLPSYSATVWLSRYSDSVWLSHRHEKWGSNVYKTSRTFIPIISSVHPLGTGQYLREYMAGAFTVGPVFFVSLFHSSCYQSTGYWLTEV